MADLPPMLSSSPPPLDRSFLDVDEEADAPSAFTIGHLDLDEDADEPLSSKPKKKRISPRKVVSHNNIASHTLASDLASSNSTIISHSNHVDALDHHSDSSTSEKERKSLGEDFLHLNGGTENKSVLFTSNATSKQSVSVVSSNNVNESGENLSIHEENIHESSNTMVRNSEDNQEPDSEMDQQQEEKPPDIPDIVSETHTIVPSEDSRVGETGKEEIEWNTLVPASENSRTPAEVEIDAVPGVNLEESLQLPNVKESDELKVARENDDENIPLGNIPQADEEQNTTVVADDDDEWAEFSEFTGEIPTDVVVESQKNIEDEFEEFQSVSVISSVPQEPTKTFAQVLNGIFADETDSLMESIPESSPTTLENLIKNGQAADVWEALKNLDETNALKFQWSNSVIRQKFLLSLNLNPQSHFTMQKKEPVPLHQNSAPSDMLIPTKVNHSKGGPALSVDSSKGLKNSPTISGGIPMTSNSMSVPSSKHEVSNSTSGTLLPTNLASKTQKPVNGVLNQKTRTQEEEVQDVIRKFRNLDFIQSKTFSSPKERPIIHKF